MNDLTLQFDLPCLYCRYNLRTLARDSRCPECGHAIADSLAPGPLASIDAPWLADQGRACLMLVISNLVFALGIYLGVYRFWDRLGVPAAIGIGGFRLWIVCKNGFLYRPLFPAYSLVVLGMILNFVAHLMLARMKAKTSGWQMSWLRTAIIMLTMVGAGFLVIIMAVSQSDREFLGIRRRRLYYDPSLATALALLDVILGTLVYLHFYRLARRLGYAILAKSTLISFILIAIPSAAAFPVLIERWLDTYRYSSYIMDNFNYFAVAGVLSLVIYVCHWRVLTRDAKVAAMIQGRTAIP